MKQLRHQENPKYKIDESRKVFIYKNLHKNCWSVKQDGLVKMHTTDLCMYDCSFRVNKKGREKVLKEKRKNVHAGISGYIDRPWVMNALAVQTKFSNLKVATYNPYKHDTFVDDVSGESLFKSERVVVRDRTAVGPHYNIFYIPEPKPESGRRKKSRKFENAKILELT